MAKLYPHLDLNHWDRVETWVFVGVKEALAASDCPGAFGGTEVGTLSGTKIGAAASLKSVYL